MERGGNRPLIMHLRKLKTRMRSDDEERFNQCFWTSTNRFVANPKIDTYGEGRDLRESGEKMETRRDI